MPSHHQLPDITFSFPVGEATARPSGHGELATPESLPAAFKLAGEDQVFSHPFHTSLWCLLRCSRTTALRIFHCPRQLVEVSSRFLLPFLQCNTHPMLRYDECTPQHQETKTYASFLSSSMYRTYKFRGCWPCWLEKPHVLPAIFVLCSLYQNA